MTQILDEIDEREGAPSASGVGRVMLCHGSFELERRVPDIGGVAAKRRGSKIHEFLMGGFPFEKLGKSQKICAERCMFEEARRVEGCNMERATQIREKRLRLLDNDRRTLFSGQSDVIYFYGETALIINYKTGFYPVTPIHENWQMISEGILTAYHFQDVVDVMTCLIHPNAPLESGSISQVAYYTSNELLFANKYLPSLLHACREALKPNASRTPSKEACMWCHGKKQGCCPEYLEKESVL